jgi:hypothetical protein
MLFLKVYHFFTGDTNFSTQAGNKIYYNNAGRREKTDPRKT